MEPAKKHSPDIEPEIRPEFGLIQGGGESTDERANLVAANTTRNETSSNLSNGEQKFGLIQGGGESTDERANLHSVEQDAGRTKEGLFVHDNTAQKPQTADIKKVKLIAKKYGGTFGIFSILGVGAVVLTSMFAPAGMIIHLLQNFTFTNDTSSVAMERRFMKVLANMTEGSAESGCQNNTKKTFRCQNKRMSNSAIRLLETKVGFTAEYPEGTKNTGKRTGYPSKNPSAFTIEVDGKNRRIPTTQLTTFLSDNPKVLRKVVGKGGAFDAGYRAWTGKHTLNKLYTKFKLSRNGGLADGENKPMTAAERFNTAREKLTSKIPTLESFDSSDGGISQKVSEKTSEHLGKAKKGGTAYTLAVANCIAVKAPTYVAQGVAAAYAAQVMVPFMDVIASPGSKAIASGSGQTDFVPYNGDDMDVVGSVLTQRTPRESDGKLTSALDSEILQKGIGVNKSKVRLSGSISPVYSILNNSVVKKSRELQQDTEKACNALMSPAAMYSAMALDSAITVAASATIIGGIIKALGGIAASEIAGKIVEKVTENAAAKLISKIVESDSIPEAKGEALGDAIGIGAMTFFAAGGMSRGLPTLKTTQLASYDNVKRENEELNRQMDVASLSPFDTSSRYTLLGSITQNIRNTAIANGGYGAGQLFSGIMQIPSMILSPTTGASASSSSTYCGYAEEYGLTTEDPNDTPAINAAGLPCTGITTEQAWISTDDAINLMANEGWIDIDATTSDDATIDDLISDGVIKKDTPLTDYIESCMDPSSGEYVYNAASCTTNSTVAPNSKIAEKLGDNACWTDQESGEKRCIDANEPIEGIKDPRAMAAVVPFLLDFQVRQAFNGEDEEPATTAVATGGPMSVTVGSYNMCQEQNHPTCPDKGTDAEKVAGVIDGSASPASAAMDIVGAQEVSPVTQKNLIKTLSGYESSPAQVPDNNGKAIFWNTAKFTKQNEGRLTGVNGNGDSNSIDNNSFPWVELQSTENSQRIFVMSIHSPTDSYGSPAERYENVQKIREWSESKSTDGSLVIITGDFNNGSKVDGGNPGAYCYLTENGTLQHARDATTNPGAAGCQGDSVPIDQIYASTNIQGMTASGWGHVSGSESSEYGTDHSPAYITYNTSATGVSLGSDEIKMPLDASMWTKYSADFLDSHTANSGTWTSGVPSLAADIGSPPDGSPVYAMVGGTVSKSTLGGHGLAIKSEIQGGTLEIAYAHGPRADNKTSYVAGEKIMSVGALGNATGGHLHVDMAFNGKGVCPQLVFKALGNGQPVDFAKFAQQSKAPC